MSRRARIVALVLLMVLPCLASADYLEVRRRATLKAEPHGEAAVILRLAPGMYLELRQETQVDGYYYAEALPGGELGWIYRTLVRRHPGAAPEPAQAADNPLSDPTSTITPEQREFARRHLAVGKPQAVYERVREGYVVAHDARLKIPAWVQYELGRGELQGSAERSDDFRADTSIPYGSRAELSDYSGSGFDRGHLAPAADMSRSEEVMSASFFLSNMCPQIGAGFNRGIWRQLEDAVRGWVEQRGTLTIIAGPVFAVRDSSVTYRVIGNHHVAVPTAFFKIVADAGTPGQTDVLAFLIDNRSVSGRDLDEFLTSVDRIEELTGLDFLSALPDVEEGTVEARIAEAVW